MSLTTDEIAHVAALAKLALSKSEQEQYAKELSVVFDYMKALDEVQTDGIEETTQVTGLEDVVRDDIVIDCNEKTKQKLVELFSSKTGSLLEVKAVFENTD